MKLTGPEHIPCDVLVIGGGGAGLRAAIRARENGASVILASKSPVGMGNNTAMALGAFAAATGERDAADNPGVHVRDTLEGGRFINNPRLVEKMAERVVGEVPFLIGCGVPFQKKGDRIVIRQAAGHSYPRHFHSVDSRGTNYTIPLKKYASKIGVGFIERVFITRLLTQNGKATGAIGVDKEGRLLVFQASAIVLATGGFGQIYLHSSNAAGITGDGHALSFHIGVPCRDMEFVQFYPTAARGTSPLTYEAFIFGLGGILRNSRGEDVMARHGLKDPKITTRDRLTLAIMKEIIDGLDVEGGVILDLEHVPAENLTRISHLLKLGTPQERRQLVVAPTAHFCMGGIVTDEEARTPVTGLFACGEVTGGFHGANRLAGNALSEIFAMGAVAGENAARLARELPPEKASPAEVAAEKARLESMAGEETRNLRELLHSLKEVAWSQVGIIRNDSGLNDAVNKISDIRSLLGGVRTADTKDLVRRLELDNMLLTAEMVARAALVRTESRGAHYRDDYPEENADWKASIWVTNRKGEMTTEKKATENTGWTTPS